MDLEMLYIMIGSQIKTGDMLYRSDDKEESWEIFQKDYRLDEIELGGLEYGFVDTYDEYGVSSQEFSEAGVVRNALMKR